MTTIDWALYTEQAVGRNAPALADVINRPLREVLTISGADPDAAFAGFAVQGGPFTASRLTVTTGTSALQAITGTTLALTTPLSPAYGGTGANNGAYVLTLAHNLTTATASDITLTATGTTNVTLPTSGTLATTDVTSLPGLTVIGIPPFLSIGSNGLVVQGSSILYGGIALKSDGTAPIGWSASNGLYMQGETGSTYDVAIVAKGGTGILVNPTGTDYCKILSRVGFNGSAPIAKPTVTGSKAANAALASLLTALASYGLVTDSST